MEEKQSLLVVTAHPDDESYMMGGTIAKYGSDENIEVTLICATRGDKGTIGEPPLCSQKELGKVRSLELRKACSIYGASLRFLDYPDKFSLDLQEADRRKLVERIADIIKELKPGVVLTFGPTGITGHPDHIAIHHAATEAFDVVADNAKTVSQLSYQPKKLYYFVLPQEGLHILSSGEVPFLEWPPPKLLSPTMFLDISDCAHVKLRGILSHRTQLSILDELLAKGNRVFQMLSSKEYFYLARNHSTSAGKEEKDMFEGII